jgi:RNA polymerase sigma-70 factor (ECF subfamily)
VFRPFCIIGTSSPFQNGWVLAAVIFFARSVTFWLLRGIYLKASGNLHLIESTDHELMLLVGKGQPQQMAELFARHHVKLYNFFRKRGNSPPASEDLVQDTFIRMLRYAASYRDSGKFVAWMYQIARNAAADSPSDTRYEDISDDAVLAALPVDTRNDPELLQSAYETGQQLQRALLRLPPDKRELVLLGRIRELNSDDLAQLFACSPSVIKVRLHRALLLLRKYFDEERQGHTPARFNPVREPV